MTSTLRLAGKVAVITGAAQGIGAAYARALAAEGAAVSVCDLSDSRALIEEIEAGGGRAAGSILDITDEAAVAKMIDDTIAGFGGVDVLVNNAALFGALTRKRLTEITAQEWDRVMTINTRGTFTFVKAVVPHMQSRGAGKIINIASTTVHVGQSMLLHYVASKGAIIAMTRAMARELGEFGITVNCIAPGLTMSDAGRSVSNPAVAAMLIQARSIKREQLPEDLIGPLLFLATDESGFVTGQTVVVDGGQIMQ